MLEKVADLAGPGIGSYEDLEKILPNDYHSLLSPKETQEALFAVKSYIETNLCRALNLMMVAVPLIVESNSGVNDYLDRDGSRTLMLLLQKAHLGEVSVTVWPQILKEMCARKNIFVFA